MPLVLFLALKVRDYELNVRLIYLVFSLLQKPTEIR